VTSLLGGKIVNNLFGENTSSTLELNLNLVLFIPIRRFFLSTVKSFWEKKKQI